jgi:hypothetical protein
MAYLLGIDQEHNSDHVHRPGQGSQVCQCVPPLHTSYPGWVGQIPGTSQQRASRLRPLLLTARSPPLA